MSTIFVSIAIDVNCLSHGNYYESSCHERVSINFYNQTNNSSNEKLKTKYLQKTVTLLHCQLFEIEIYIV